MYSSGRPIGNISISLNQIEIIVELSEKGKSRREIAEAAGCSKDSVWRYQKKFGFL